MLFLYHVEGMFSNIVVCLLIKCVQFMQELHEVVMGNNLFYELLCSSSFNAADTCKCALQSRKRLGNGRPATTVKNFRS